MNQTSPLRYPGGKSLLAPILAEIIQLNNISGCAFVEPFAGGAGAALRLLFSGAVSQIYLNDKDYFIYSFWKSVLQHTDEFLALLSSTPVTVRTWKRQKLVLRNYRQHSLLEVGFATFFLNRSNRSGVLNGGPIGGLAQDGDYKIGARFNRNELAQRIQRIARCRRRIHVFNTDATKFLRDFCKTNAIESKRCFVYLDPPYFDKARRLYSFYFKDSDHVQLAHFLNKHASFRWVASYDNRKQIRDLYKLSKRTLPMRYSLHSARVRREVLIASRNCLLPRNLQTH